MSVTIMFSSNFLLIKRNYFIFYLCNFSFDIDTDQNAIFPILIYFRLTQFSYTEIGNFLEDFKSVNKIPNFDTQILAIFMMILCF